MITSSLSLPSQLHLAPSSISVWNHLGCCYMFCSGLITSSPSPTLPVPPQSSQPQPTHIVPTPPSPQPPGSLGLSLYQYLMMCHVLLWSDHLLPLPTLPAPLQSQRTHLSSPHVPSSGSKRGKVVMTGSH